VMINEGKVVASGAPSKITAELFPDKPDADLNDAFIKLMDRSSHN
jgi:hypothetical protein